MIKYNPDIHYRKTIRLKHYDYADAGGYFITICMQNRECLFGEIGDGEMVLNDAGKTAEKCWEEIPAHYPNVILDAYLIMPNHVHGIIVINCRGEALPRPKMTRANILDRATQWVAPTIKSNTIGSIVGQFKSITTKQINRHRQTPGFPVWQRNYYEHIIRNEKELNQIREYIGNNPVQWHLDKENPQNLQEEQ